MDISDTIVPRSDQINADSLISGPITVTITGVTRSNDEQPVTIEISGGHLPWRPCKSMRRLMIMAWPDCVIAPVPPATKPTIDPTCWIGRSLTLIRDPNVRWGKDVVGGIRISAMSHIKTKFEVALAESKGKKKLVTVDRIDTNSLLKSEPPKQESKSEGLTLVQKYAKRLAELKPEEITPAYHKFDSVAPTMDESTAQAIYALFAKYAPQQQTSEPVI